MAYPDPDSPAGRADWLTILQNVLPFVDVFVPSYEEIYRLRHERGDYITVLARARWESQADGQTGRRILGYVIDVTARSADFDRLRVREERFRMSLSALHGVVYDLDLRTNRSERHGVRRMLGHETLEAEDGYGGWLSIIHPEDQARVIECVNASRCTASNFEMSYRVRHLDGRWRHVRQRGTYMLGHDGEPIRAFGVIEDVTDAEAQREQLQMQAAIIERMSEGVLLLSRDGTILFANPALEKMFGYARGELQGRASHDLSFRSKANFDGLVSAVFEGTENDRTSIIDLEVRPRGTISSPR
jgi:PAS domain S-box-containing protein